MSDLITLALERFQALTLVARQAGLEPQVALGLAHHSRSVSALQPILAAIETIAAHSEG